MKRFVPFVLVLVFSGTFAFAHGNEQYIMGKVTKISNDSITIDTVKKETKTVEIASTTKFFKSGSPASIKELNVGDSVVVHAEKKREKLEAHEVRFGAGNQAKHRH